MLYVLHRSVLFPVILSDPNYPKPPRFRHFVSLFISLTYLPYFKYLYTWNTVGRLLIASAPWMANRTQKKAWLCHVNHLNIGGTNHISETADRLRCCQLRWMVSVVNWWRSRSQFITLTVDICVQHGGPEAPRSADLSAAAETCTKWQ